MKKPGRLLQLSFRGLLSVHSRYGLYARGVALATLSIEGFSSFVASTTASIATGWSEPVPGRDLHPLKSSAFSRRTFSPTIVRDCLGGGRANDAPAPVLVAALVIPHLPIRLLANRNEHAAPIADALEVT